MKHQLAEKQNTNEISSFHLNYNETYFSCVATSKVLIYSWKIPVWYVVCISPVSEQEEVVWDSHKSDNSNSYWLIAIILILRIN